MILQGNAILLLQNTNGADLGIWRDPCIIMIKKKGSSLFCMGEPQSLILCASVPLW